MTTKIRQIITALEIVEKYKPDEDEPLVPDHDIIRIGHELDLSAEDKAKLKALEWSYDDDLRCWYLFT